MPGCSHSVTSDESWNPSECNPSSASEISMESKASEKEAETDSLSRKRQREEKQEASKKESGDKSKGKKVKSGKERKAAEKRNKSSCPALACKAEVVHLPRHMRNVHKWTKEAASKVLLKYNIRKRKLADDKKRKDYHRRRRCPMNDCHSIVFRLPAHLRKVHKLDRASTEYSTAMAAARVVPDQKHGMIRYKEEHYRYLATGRGFVDDDGGNGNADNGDGSNNGAGNIDCDNDDDGYVDGGCDGGDDDGDDGDDDDGGDDDGDDGDDHYMVQGVQDCDKAGARHPILVELEQWLLSPDGGKLDANTVKQHCGSLATILRVLSESGDIASLLDIKLVQSVFLNGYLKEKGYGVGTVKSYLMSLRHYFSFLLSERPAEVEFHPEDVRAARDKVRMWSKAYKKDSSTRRWQKLEEDQQNLLTPANIQLFERSEAARTAVKILGQHSDTTETVLLTQQSYTLVRDFLFTQMFIDNANRPGVLSCMTMHEYQHMRKEGENHVIVTKKHKTAHVHGPAYIVLSKKLKGWLTIFVEIMRAQVTSSTTGALFLSWNAKSMTSSQINKAVQSVFRKAGVKGKVTSTSFRKAAVTNIHQSNPELSSKLAKLMAHNELTAKRYYLLSEKTKASVEASKRLGQVMRNEVSGEAEETADSESKGDKSVADDGMSEEKKRAAWTDSDLEKVENRFSEELKNKTITLDLVRKKVEKCEELSGMSPRRVYDKLKKLAKEKVYSCSNVGHELPKAQESLDDKLERMANVSNNPSQSVPDDQQSSLGIIPPTEKSSGILSEWEIQTINKMFPDMIANKPISKSEITKRCAASQDGQKLLKHLTICQVVNRIKYARRKVRENAQK